MEDEDLTYEELTEDIEGEVPIEQVIPEGRTVVMRDDDTLRVEIRRQGNELVATYRDPGSGDTVLRIHLYADGSSTIEGPSIDPNFWTILLNGEEVSLQDLRGIESFDETSLDADNKELHIQT